MDENFVKHLKNILFIDIETVSQVGNFSELDEELKPFWLKKSPYFNNPDELSDEALFLKKASLYAEFGKIICIGIGGLTFDDNNIPSLRLKSIKGENEAEILVEFKKIIELHKAGKNLMLCAHNGKEFDFPFICRRMLIHGIELPNILQIAGKKPWEINHLDTLDFWKFGEYKHYTSLDLLAHIFKIPNSNNNEIRGDQVNEIYYKDKNIKKIAHYCLSDVAVLTQLYMKMNNYPLIENSKIIFKD